MLITNLIFSFSIFSRSNFLLVCNYINNIYLFQKLNIFLYFKDSQIWLTQLLYWEANFANSYVTVQKLWYIWSYDKFTIWKKTTLSSVEVLSDLVFWHEIWTLFNRDCCICRENNSNSKTFSLNFLSVIEDILVLLTTGFSY